MGSSAIFERVKKLCDDDGITISFLLHEITGNVGNAPTWKKGHIRTDYLAAICTRFGVTADYLLGLSDMPIPSESVMPHELSIIEKLRALPPETRQAVETLLNQL